MCPCFLNNVNNIFTDDDNIIIFVFIFYDENGNIIYEEEIEYIVSLF
jgi:hypothetical protein